MNGKFRGDRFRDRKGIFGASKRVLILLSFIVLVFSAIRADAGPAPVGYPAPAGYGNYTAPPMDIALLISAIQGDTAAIARFDAVSDHIEQLVSDPSDPLYMQPAQTCVPATPDPICSDVVSAGGQNMINMIVNAIEDSLGVPRTAPEEWWAPSAVMPSPQRTPSDVSAVVAFLNQVQTGEAAPLQQLQAIFVGNDFFRPYGFKPYTQPKPPVRPPAPQPPPPAPSGLNVGVDALAFIAGGTGVQALTTIGLAQQGDANAIAVMQAIFAFAQECQTDPTEPAEAACLAERYGTGSNAFRSTMEQGVMPASYIDTDLPDTAGEIIMLAIPSPPQPVDANATAQQFTVIAMSGYLARIDDPSQTAANCPPFDTTCEAYGGPAAVLFLQSALSVLPPPPPPVDIQPPAAPGNVSVSPLLNCVDTGTPPASNLAFTQRCANNETVVGAGLHAIPSPGDNNTATLPCQWESPNVDLQVTDNASARFSHDPCWLRDASGNTVLDSDGNAAPSFTRNTRKLDFAQKFKAGEQWAGYFTKWVQQQWIPSLRMMTAQLTAATIDQTMKMGIAFDAMAIQKTAAMIQKREFESKTGLKPGEQACTSLSPAHGIVRSHYYSNMMSSALGSDLQSFAGTGQISGNGAP